jgi:dephospho-CoA kinase
MRLIGITGGIGSGKSTVGRILTDRGYAVVDTDDVARDLTSPGSPVLDEIVKEFGSGVLLPDGGLDRKKVASIVFKDSSRMNKLESILHPMIIEESRIRAEKSGQETVFIVVPLLFEAGLEKRFDKIWLCYAPLEIRIERVIKRDKVSREQVIDRVRAQMPDEEKKSKSDFIINTGGSIEEMELNVREALLDL